MMEMSTYRTMGAAGVQPMSQGPGVLGDYLLATGKISMLQLSQAVRSQFRSRQRIGEVLLAQQLITPVMLVEALVQQSVDRLDRYRLAPRYLGEYALASDLISPEQLSAALFTQIVNQQRGFRLQLGAILVRQGALGSPQLRWLLQQIDPG